jgi:hypothetical protein
MKLFIVLRSLLSVLFSVLFVTAYACCVARATQETLQALPASRIASAVVAAQNIATQFQEIELRENIDRNACESALKSVIDSAGRVVSIFNECFNKTRKTYKKSLYSSFLENIKHTEIPTENFSRAVMKLLGIISKTKVSEHELVKSINNVDYGSAMLQTLRKLNKGFASILGRVDSISVNSLYAEHLCLLSGYVKTFEMSFRHAIVTDENIGLGRNDSSVKRSLLPEIVNLREKIDLLDVTIFSSNASLHQRVSSLATCFDIKERFIGITYESGIPKQCGDAMVFNKQSIFYKTYNAAANLKTLKAVILGK